MLETTVIGSNGKKRSKRLLVLPISIALHLALLAGAVFASVWRVDLPENPPAQVTSYRPMMAVPLPPPAPSAQQRSSRPVQQPPVDPTQPVAPTLIPEKLPPISEPGSIEGSENGSPDGVPGGEPGGHPDGIPGGVSLPGLVVDTPKIHPVSGEVKRPKILVRIEPKYPEHARRIKLEGWVAVECIVDKNGRTQNLRIVGSSHEIFEPAAIEALQAWRFSAGTLNGEAVNTIFTLRVNFQLSS